MKSSVVSFLFCLVCLLPGAGVLAQDIDETPAADSSDGQQALNNEIQPAMSPAAAAEPEPEALVVSEADTGQALYLSAPGACVVVDAFVRQFCAANPGDISCQFQ